MKTPLILTFDVGTQSTRCLLVRPDGSFADLCQVKHDPPYRSRNPGWAEQDPDFYYQRICETGRAVCQRSEGLLGDIVAVALTTIRDTVLCLDGDNRPLRDAILWLDKRRAQFDDPIPLYNKLLFRAVGMSGAVENIYRASACNWIAQRQPELWARTAKYVMLPTYLNYKMTGVLADCAANMIGHMPFDYKRRRWQGPSALTRCVYNIPQEKLCELTPSGQVIGRVTREFSADSGVPEGLPLIATGSDKGCETLGLSVIQPHKAAISLGTTATIQLALERYVEPQPFMPAYPAVSNHLYNPEIELYRGFWLVSWFLREFCAKDLAQAKELGCSPEELLDRYIADIPPGCGGLLLQPYWTPGITTPAARGAIVGLTDHHTRYHLYRAILEGIAFELYDSLKRMEKRAGIRVEEIYVGGGGARSNVACQILSDLFGLPVKRTQTHEVSAVGAAMAAFLAQGIFHDYDEAIRSMVHEGDAFHPDPDRHKLYAQLYRGVYARLYPRLEPLYRRISEITKRSDVL